MTIHFEGYVLVLKQNCHPDRSVAKWRDLLLPYLLHIPLPFSSGKQDGNSHALCGQCDFL
jgi:hypothetical protein